MKQFVGEVVLLNRRTGEFDRAEVFRTLDSADLDSVQRDWKPLLDKWKNRSDAGKAHAEDAHWDWLKEVRKASRSMGAETFSVECGGVIQGLMVVDMTKFARLEVQKGRELVYVDRVATAPFNRPKLVPDPHYKGVGRVLIATAVSLSFSEELDFRGRIGLHSLPQSEDRYRQMGFTEVEFDQRKKMRYFEMTEAQAAQFLTEPEEL
ncbi:MAG: hypothetical protein OSA84_13120 [Akkermansiaceae bacterium]|nr:hypothetical protein [Akkermansiaceae bacterium]